RGSAERAPARVTVLAFPRERCWCTWTPPGTPTAPRPYPRTCGAVGLGRRYIRTAFIDKGRTDRARVDWATPGWRKRNDPGRRDPRGRLVDIQKGAAARR